MISFKEKCNFEQRKKESEIKLKQYPDRVPVIVEKCIQGNNPAPLLAKNKFLVPSNMKMHEFYYDIRKRLILSPAEAIFIFVNNSPCILFDSLGTIYNNNKDPDGFLYLTYALENTFGKI